MSLSPNTLYYGDCLEWMRLWPDECVDLIYLDPPFNSKADYNMLYSDTGKGDAQYRAFTDTWGWDEEAADRYKMYKSAPGRPSHYLMLGLWRFLGPSGMLAYLTYMAERLEEMHRLLKPTGSIYLHCDSHASHYLKLVMDAVFDPRNFRNEIVWKRAHPKGNASRRLDSLYDTIFAYSRDESRAKWNPIYVPKDPERARRQYSGQDPDGRRYQLTSLLNSNPNRPDLTYEFKGVTRVWRWTRERMVREDAKGRIVVPHQGQRIPRYKRYLDEQKGDPLGDLWADISFALGRERLGYPTQKPLKLLRRIIEASSDPEDVVLDPFCGCGTAVEAADKAGRKWAGIDISSFAIDLIREKRLKDNTIPVRGIPHDLRSAKQLANERPFAFETWAVTRIPGFAPNMKQSADGGVDGRATLAMKPSHFDSRHALVQVKGSGKFNLSALRDFLGVVRRDNAAWGCYITLEPVTSRAARQAIADMGTITVLGRSYRRVELWSIRDYFAKKSPGAPPMTDPYTGDPLPDQYDAFS